MISNEEDKTLDKETEDDARELEDEKIACEDINDAENLEKKKQEVKRFYAENNHAYTQSFIQEAQTVNYNINNMMPVKCKLSVDKQFDLSDSKECIEFVTEFKNTEYFYTAFILSMFQKVDVFDMKELKTLLSTCLADLYGNEKEDEFRKSEYIGPYVAQDSILSVINGEKYIQEGRNYLGFGDKREVILKNLMEQFSDLQNTLLNMIEIILGIKHYRSNFYLIQIATLLKDLWEDAIIDVEHRILPGLCKSERNVGLLGAACYFLYENENTRADVAALMYKWLRWNDKWLWKIPCLVYVQLEIVNSEEYFVDELEKVIVYKLISYRKKDYHFLAEMLMLSKEFRDMVCRAFQKLYSKVTGHAKKSELGHAYLYLVRGCYYRVSDKNMSLPLIVCDTKKQLIQLKEIYEDIINNYRLRQQLFSILNVYLRELSRYDFTNSLVNRIAAFFYFLMLENKDFQSDLEDVIVQSSNKISKQIMKIIYT